VTISLDGGEVILDTSALLSLMYWGPEALPDVVEYLGVERVHIHAHTIYSVLDSLQAQSPDNADHHHSMLVHFLQGAQALNGLLRYATHPETLQFVIVHSQHCENRVQPSLLIPIALASAKNSDENAETTYSVATVVMSDYNYDMPPEFDRALLIDCRDLFRA